MRKIKRGIVRIEYDRSEENRAIGAFWTNAEEMPYYALEKHYTENSGTGPTHVSLDLF